jgi:hypothetical protein
MHQNTLKGNEKLIKHSKYVFYQSVTYVINILSIRDNFKSIEKEYFNALLSQKYCPVMKKLNLSSDVS